MLKDASKRKECIKREYLHDRLHLIQLFALVISERWFNLAENFFYLMDFRQ